MLTARQSYILLLDNLSDFPAKHGRLKNEWSNTLILPTQATRHKWQSIEQIHSHQPVQGGSDDWIPSFPEPTRWYIFTNCTAYVGPVGPVLMDYYIYIISYIYIYIYDVVFSVLLLFKTLIPFSSCQKVQSKYLDFSQF